MFVQGANGAMCLINDAEGLFAACADLSPPPGGWVLGQTVKKSCYPKCGD